MTDPTRDIDKLISKVSPELQQTVRTGFASANTIPEATRAQVIELFATNLGRGVSAINIDEIAKTTGIDRGDADDLLAAISATFAVLSQTEVTAEEFVDRAMGKWFHESDSQTALSIAKVMLTQRAALRDILRRTQLANATLPSMETFTSSVDLRLGFKEEKLDAGVPVAVVHIATDVGPEIWFQITRSDVGVIIKKLQDVDKRMEIAERLLERAKADLGS